MYKNISGSNSDNCGATVPRVELLKYATAYFKSKGYKKQGSKIYKVDDEFLRCFQLELSSLKGYYYVRPYIGIVQIYRKIIKNFNFDMILKCFDMISTNIWVQSVERMKKNSETPQTAEEIVLAVDRFFEDWTDKEKIFENVKKYLEWDNAYPLETRQKLGAYAYPPCPIDPHFGGHLEYDYLKEIAPTLSNPSISKKQLIEQLSRYVKEQGFQAEQSNLWTKQMGNFKAVILVDKSIWKEEDYDIRLGVSVTNVQIGYKGVGHFATVVPNRNITFEEICDKINNFFVTWTDKKRIIAEVEYREKDLQGLRQYALTKEYRPMKTKFLLRYNLTITEREIIDYILSPEFIK